MAWATLYGLGGYWLGGSIHRLRGPVALSSIVLATLLTIAFLIFVRRNERQLEAEAERALPGPLDGYQPKARTRPARRPHVPLPVSSQDERDPAPSGENEPLTTDEESKDRAEPEQENTQGSERLLKI
jgi:hypothetical protein